MTHNDFLSIAAKYANDSKCGSMKVGALIVLEDRIISCGINGTPPKFTNCNELFPQGRSKEHSEWSRQHEIHAEMNAILFATLQGGLQPNQYPGYRMYCTLSPCKTCLTHMAVVGIKEVYYSSEYVPYGTPADRTHQLISDRVAYAGQLGILYQKIS